MKPWKVLRAVGLIMLMAAAVFVICALSDPTLGSMVYIGKFALGAEVWRVFYVLYLTAAAGLLCASFVMRRRGGK